MRILNQDNNIAVRNVLLMLTMEEAAELKDDLERLLSKKALNDHSHINDLEYEHELTISLYDENNIEEFDERIKKLIIQDE
ncbi:MULTISPECIES: hypothetical protein [Clostridia]|jgi:hypothetical protein|uniref:SPRY domain containing protein n=1 Tax=Acetivibrio thermocellus (strain ATCC 27405 / DSM 1237 / JCM 9322 / NBRC 103400 / NCIMB 10682 / NRRL B-4536 / VPI 7372) TaxID=203119 RepID=A3DGX1_ACET2|nr:hypothetical protein [Acetivibrio thermocellus]ABN53200.1 SPRY domain containing protein [Acetivibrio thermocellus ATCC 27405]